MAADEPSTWAALWVTPQAAAWEQLGYLRTVARYALLLSEVEVPDAKGTILAEVRQLEDRLGLNPKAMRSLLWEITDDEMADRRNERSQSRIESKRTSLRIVG